VFVLFSVCLLKLKAMRILDGADHITCPDVIVGADGTVFSEYVLTPQK
jgi:hypothetical protein